MLGSDQFHHPGVTTVGLVLLAPPILVIAGLIPRSSKRFFDLRCPECQAYKARAASFLYNKLKCGKCKATWRLREERVALEAFD